MLSTFLLFARFRYLGRTVRAAGTWDCGYAVPTARMEYTGTAFTQPLTDLFGVFLRPLKKLRLPKGFFPVDAALETEVPDGGERTLWRPLFCGFAKVAEKLHFLQSGYLHFYLLVVVITLLVMLLVGLYIPVEVVK
jgi:hydrogenase-4 component B